MKLPEIKSAFDTRTKVEEEKREVKRQVAELRTVSASISIEPVTLAGQSSAPLSSPGWPPRDRSVKRPKPSSKRARRFSAKSTTYPGHCRTPRTRTSPPRRPYANWPTQNLMPTLPSISPRGCDIDQLAARDRKDNAALEKHYDRGAIEETLRYIHHQERYLEHLGFPPRPANRHRGHASVPAEIAAYSKSFEQFQARSDSSMPCWAGFQTSQTQLGPKRPGCPKGKHPQLHLRWHPNRGRSPEPSPVRGLSDGSSPSASAAVIETVSFRSPQSVPGAAPAANAAGLTARVSNPSYAGGLDRSDRRSQDWCRGPRPAGASAWSPPASGNDRGDRRSQDWGRRPRGKPVRQHGVRRLAAMIARTDGRRPRPTWRREGIRSAVPLPGPAGKTSPLPPPASIALRSSTPAILPAT